MSIRATVNYHFAKPERQAYEIDSGGVEGKIVSPPHDLVEIDVTDLRTSGRLVNFKDDSVEFRDYPSAITSYQEPDWQSVYDTELTMLLKSRLEARDVIIFDHTVRIDDPNSDRKPARNVHSDYSRDGAHQRLRDLVGKAEATEWEAGHFAFINVWRPVERPIESAPLGFVRPASVAREDWLLLDLIYPDRMGQIMGLVHNRAHDWLYRSAMRPDEVVFFNIYDNRGQPSIAHSALDLADAAPPTQPRKSIESRTLVRFA